MRHFHSIFIRELFNQYMPHNCGPNILPHLHYTLLIKGNYDILLSALKAIKIENVMRVCNSVKKATELLEL